MRERELYNIEYSLWEQGGRVSLVEQDLVLLVADVQSRCRLLL